MMSRTDGALATAPAREAPIALPQPAPEHTPQRAPRPPRQQPLFGDLDAPKVIPFPGAPAAPQAPAAKPRPRRPPPPPRQIDAQQHLDFLTPAPHTPRTLKTTVEPSIYCDAPVATPLHRAVAGVVNFGLVFAGMAVFVATYSVFGGEVVITKQTLPFYGIAFVAIAFFYGLVWTLAGSESPGARWLRLRVVSFDGPPADRRERTFRFLGACLSVAAAGLGLLW
ncbi:MAG: RDD family protein, partial [Bryobacteraceae bacterium]